MRFHAIDFTKSLAIVMIVTCHYLMFSRIFGLSGVGRFLADTGNFIFFAISAVLFGLRYEQKGASAFEAKPFMKKRLVRLFASLWPFLIAILTIYSFIGVEYNVVKAVMNFVGLGWFGKLPNIGHLWFVTMIIFCYTMYVCVTRTQIINRLNRGGVFMDYPFINQHVATCDCRFYRPTRISILGVVLLTMVLRQCQ